MSAVLACDEGRFGLKTWLRRRWCPRGSRPPWVVGETYEWLWVYVAIEPTHGRAICLLLPHVDGQCFGRFLDTTSAQYPGEQLLLLLDNAPSHHNQQVDWPANLTPLYLPPYSPELNPAEQVFRHLRKVLSNRVFENLDELESALIDALRTFYEHPEVVISLTNYPWWQHAIGSSSS